MSPGPPPWLPSAGSHQQPHQYL